jgi:hypothetical protein
MSGRVDQSKNQWHPKSRLAKRSAQFYFCFPERSDGQCTQIWVAATKVDDKVGAMKFQQELVMAYPNVSLID